jgi:quinol monooxygenase YgiN
VNAARREVYVYYRVAPAHWLETADAVAQWQREMCRSHPGLVASVLRRPEAHDDVVTLMEVYAGSHTIDAAFEATIARGAEALGPWLLGERHIERFDALD